MPTTFPSLAFGPLAVRHLIAERRAPGERLVAWAPVQAYVAPRRAMAKIAAMVLLPWFGAVLMAAIWREDQRRWLLVVTTRRLMLVWRDAGRHRPLRGWHVDVDAGLGDVIVTLHNPPDAAGRTEKTLAKRLTRVVVEARGCKPIEVAFQPRGNQDAARLAEALAVFEAGR